jgi:hypothetical protein
MSNALRFRCITAQRLLKVGKFRVDAEYGERALGFSESGGTEPASSCPLSQR